MIILAFETSHAQASVALSIDDKVIVQKIVTSRRHEETVMPAVATLLENNQISPDEVDLVAVDIGPGSFTGIRIGTCHANAFADAVQKPCIGICSLEAMAYSRHSDGNVGVMIDAGNDNCYAAVYDNKQKTVYGPLAETKNEFLSSVGSYNCKEIIGDTEEYTPDAGIIACLAKQKYLAENNSDSRAMPFYMRPSQAERKRNK